MEKRDQNKETKAMWKETDYTGKIKLQQQQKPLAYLERFQKITQLFKEEQDTTKRGHLENLIELWEN